MKILLGFGAVMIIFVLIIGSWLMGSYNGLVRQNEAVTTQWAQVETQYQRRFDLIPGLVNATKGFLRQEQAVFGAIAEARTRYSGAPSGTDAKVQAAGQLEGALARLLIVMENYPVLKSDQTVQALMDELSGTENRIAIARDRYNLEVRGYNVSVKSFPRNVIAGMFGFKERTFFESVKEANKAVDTNLELDHK